MAKTRGAGGGGRSPSFTSNPRQKGYKGPNMVGSQMQPKSSSNGGGGSRGTVSPLVGVPVIGGFDQMRRNTDAIKSALGGRVSSKRSAPKRAPMTAKSSNTGGGGKSTPKKEQSIGTPSTGRPARKVANKVRAARGKTNSLSRKLELRGNYGPQTLRKRAVQLSKSRKRK